MPTEVKAVSVVGRDIYSINQALKNLSAEGWGLVSVATVGDMHLLYVQRQTMPKKKPSLISRFMPLLKLTLKGT